MGYYTKYELTVNPPTPGAIEAARQAGSGEGNYCLAEDGSTRNSGKWYDHEDEMQFPDVVFHLRGEGEEPGDIWEKDFKNGKRQVRKAQIVIAPFDPDRWE